MIKSLPIRSEPEIVQKPIYSLTTEFHSGTRMSEEMSKIESLPIRSEPEITQKPIYSLTTEFHSETRMSEESSKIEYLSMLSQPQIAEKPSMAQMSSVGSPKLSILCQIFILFFYSLYRI